MVKSEETVSGKRFTLGVLGILGVILVVGLPILLRFHFIQTKLDVAKERWPAAATQWSRYFDAVRAELIQAEGGQEALAKWDVEAETFRRFAARQDQLEPAKALRRLCDEARMVELLGSSSTLKQLREEVEASQAFQEYLEAERDLREAEHSWLGTIARGLLRLPLSNRWDL